MSHIVLRNESDLIENIDHIENKVINKHAFVLLVFADWCGHCTRMRDDWDKAAQNSSKTHILEVESKVLQIIMRNDAFAKHQLREILEYSEGFPYIVNISKLNKAKNSININNFQGPRTMVAFKRMFADSAKPKVSPKQATPKPVAPAKKPVAPAKKPVAPAKKPVAPAKKPV